MGYAYAVLGVLSIGPFILPFPLIATVILTRRPTARQGYPGLLAGPGIAAVLVAYDNRHGPGDVCTRTTTSVECGQQWNPWPWLIVGTVLVMLAIAWFLARHWDANRSATTSHQ